MASWHSHALAALVAWAALGAPAVAQERIGGAAISREKAEGGAGAMLIRIAGVVGGATRPRIGGDVTAIPYDRALPTVQVKVKAIGQRRERHCTSLKLYDWPLELDDIADGAYAAYRAGTEGDLGPMLLLYPPRPKAKALAPGSVPAGDLPQSRIPSELYAAFDFDGDGRPELVEMKTCCAPLAKDKTCAGGSSCVKSYRRGPKRWHLIDQREEC